MWVCESLRLAQRGSGFLGDVRAAEEEHLSEAGAVGGEGNDRGVGDVGAAEAHGCEGRAVGGEGDDRGVGDVVAVVEVNGGERRAVGGGR